MDTGTGSTGVLGWVLGIVTAVVTKVIYGWFTKNNPEEGHRTLALEAQNLLRRMGTSGQDAIAETQCGYERIHVGTWIAGERRDAYGYDALQSQTYVHAMDLLFELGFIERVQGDANEIRYRLTDLGMDKANGLLRALKE